MKYYFKIVHAWLKKKIEVKWYPGTETLSDTAMLTKALEQPRVKTYTMFGLDCHFQNNKMYKNGKVDSLWGWMLPEICLMSKMSSNKNY